MGACLIGLSFIFLIIGLVQFLSPDPKSSPGKAYVPAVNRERQFPPPPSRSAAPPAPVSARAAQSIPTGGNMPSLSNIQVGQRVRVRHPIQGELNVYVFGRVVFDELWQTSRGSQSPWVPTGNAYSGFWLETNLLLLNWQNRYYLLDERIPVSDPEIQRDFSAHARKFAQSNQTAEVLFSYPPTMWKMDDIGKFRIRTCEGEGLNPTPLEWIRLSNV